MRPVSHVANRNAASGHIEVSFQLALLGENVPEPHVELGFESAGSDAVDSDAKRGELLSCAAGELILSSVGYGVGESAPYRTHAGHRGDVDDVALGLFEMRQAGLTHHDHRLDGAVDAPVPVIHGRRLQGLDALTTNDVDQNIDFSESFDCVIHKTCDGILVGTVANSVENFASGNTALDQLIDAGAETTLVDIDEGDARAPSRKLNAASSSKFTTSTSDNSDLSLKAVVVHRHDAGYNSQREN